MHLMLVFNVSISTFRCKLIRKQKPFRDNDDLLKKSSYKNSKLLRVEVKKNNFESLIISHISSSFFFCNINKLGKSSQNTSYILRVKDNVLKLEKRILGRKRILGL